MKVFAKALDAQLQCDTRTRSALVNGKLVDLRDIEFNILEYLAVQPRFALSHEKIIHALYTDLSGADTKVPRPMTITVYVCRLRKKLAAAHRDAALFVQTVRNGGYCFDGTDIRYA